MTFEIRIDTLALADIDEFVSYQKNYSEAFALEQIERLDYAMQVSIATSPATWKPFFITGAPYHAYLFRVGRRTSYWIVYTIDETAKRVDVLRFWNASREPQAFEI